MANAQVEDLANTIMKASLFGRNVDIQFETAETERKEKGRKIKLEKKRREEEIRKEEEEKLRQERFDFRFAQEEQERLNREFQLQNSPQRLKTGRGRAALSREMVSYQPMKGRGRFAPNDQNASFFLREEGVKRQLHQFSDGMYQTNHFQKQVWLGDAPTTSFATRDNTSPLHGDTFLEQFEDARSSSRSSLFDSPHSESASFHSVASSNSTNSSPIPAATQAVTATGAPPAPTIEEKSKTTAQISRVCKPRSRIAAKFDFNNEDELPEEVKAVEKENPIHNIQNHIVNNNNVPQKYDPLAILTSHDRRSAPTRIRMGPESISINDLRASQRILSKGLLRPEEIMSNPYRESCEFNYNKNDFPSL